MTSATSSIPGRRGLRRPRAIGILVAAALIVGMTYVSSVLLRPASPSKAPVRPGGRPRRSGSPRIPRRCPARWPRSIAGSRSGRPTSRPSRATSCRRRPSAALYHERGRLTGDLADHQRALEAAQTAARIAPTEPAGRLLEAAVRYTLHDFSGAFADADALYRGDPTQLGALATRADAELELGRVGDARCGLRRPDLARRRSRRRRPARPPGDRHRPAGRGAPPGTLRPRRRPGAGSRGRDARCRVLPVRGRRIRPAGRRCRLGAAGLRRGARRARHRPRRAGRPRADRRLRGAHERRHRRAREGGRDRPAARDAGAAGRPAGSDRRRHRGVAPVRDRALHRATGRDREHRLRPLADPLRARPRLRHPRRCSPRPRHRSPRAPTRPVTTRSPGRCIDSAGSTSRRDRDRGRRGATGPPTRGCSSIAARSPWPMATRPAGVLRSRPRSRSDRRSIRSNAPRLSGSSAH